MISVVVIDRDNNETNRSLSAGSKLSAIVNLSRDAVLLNDQPVPQGRDPELRDGDEVTYVRKSHKAG